MLGGSFYIIFLRIPDNLCRVSLEYEGNKPWKSLGYHHAHPLSVAWFAKFFLKGLTTMFNTEMSLTT